MLNASGGIHYRAFLEATRRILGVECSLDGIMLYGNTELGILRESAARAGVSAEKMEASLGEILKEMNAAVSDGRYKMKISICPGVPALLDLLTAGNKLLGVATGNLEDVGWAKVEAASLRHHFQFGAFAERDSRETRTAVFAWGLEESRRRLGSSARVCFVGDTPADIESAKALDCPVIAVATGIHPFETLAPLGAEICLRSLEELSATG